MTPRIPWLFAAPLVLAAVSFAASAAHAGDATGGSALVQALPRAKHSLLEGVRAVAKSPAVALSAKFEDEGKGLSLSVYTAARGLEVEAESNVLQEWAGDPTAAEWKPFTETFADVVHVARASEQLTLMRLTNVTLADVISRVERSTRGTVYSIVPKIVDNHAVFVVEVAIEGRPDEVTVDLYVGTVLTAPRAGWPIPPLDAPNYVGKPLPEIVVGRGRWIGAAPTAISAEAGHVVLVVSNSFLCEGTDEAWTWERLVPLYEELESKGLTIRFVLAEAESAEAVAAYVAQRKIRYPVLHDPAGENAKRWEVGRSPAAFVVGANGLVVWQGYWQPAKAADACERAVRAALDRLPPPPR